MQISTTFAPKPVHFAYFDLFFWASILLKMEDAAPNSPLRKKSKLGTSGTLPQNIVRLRFPGGVLDPLLLEHVTYIVHQVNATGNSPGGLAAALVREYEAANVWARESTEEHLLGSVRIDHTENVAIVSMYGQMHGGKPLKHGDKKADRASYFARCLSDLRTKLPDVCSIAFPEKIGCVIAGGDWSEYLAMITDFAVKMPNATVYIVTYGK